MIATPAVFKATCRAGFTLIELSIVLIIIGLIIGGVLVGQDLIHSAQIRKQISDWEKLNTAVAVFKGKYNCFPGDCINATDFFTGTGNGNGDGIIFGDTNWYDASHFTLPERCLFYVHLGMAQLWPPLPTIDSICQANSIIIAGQNMPALTIGNGSYFVSAPTDSTGNSPAGQSHYICTNSAVNQQWIRENSTEISTSDALRLDSKLDDGLPTTGNIQSTTYAFPYMCATTPAPSATGCISTAAGNPYNLSSSATGCSLRIKAPF